MNRNQLLIRVAAFHDAEAILAIYAPYVEKTAITFEYDVPSLEEIKIRMKNTLRKYPYLVAEKNGEVLGYAYTGSFIPRAAYAWAAETSVYIKEDHRKMGIGQMLYRALEDISRAQNLLNLNACIGYPEIEDAYLTKNSVQFHEHLGYEITGHFHQCGYKFGTWYDMVWMEKMIGDHRANPSPFIPFSELAADTLLAIGIN